MIQMARLPMQSHVARIVSIKVAYLLEQSHFGALIAATSSTILVRDKLETSNRSPEGLNRSCSSIKFLLDTELSLRPAKWESNRNAGRELGDSTFGRGGSVAGKLV
jgi:hypothetical protein